LLFGAAAALVLVLLNPHQVAEVVDLLWVLLM